MPPKIMTIILWDKPLWLYCMNNSLPEKLLLCILKWKRFKHLSCVHECFIDPFRRVHICCNLEKMKSLIFVILPTFKTENQVKNSFQWLGIDLVLCNALILWWQAALGWNSLNELSWIYSHCTVSRHHCDPGWISCLKCQKCAWLCLRLVIRLFFVIWWITTVMLKHLFLIKFSFL